MAPTANIPSPADTVLAYLAAAYQVNPEAEVSGPELRHELGLDDAAVQECVTLLAHEGLVEWDPLLSNIWVRLTDLGLVRTGVPPA